MSLFRAMLLGIFFLLSTALCYAQFKCVVTITSPPSEISTFDDSVTVTGVVNTEGGRPPLRDSCEVNGIPFTPVAGNFSVRVPLPEDGANAVRASCTFFDADGQTTTCDHTIIVFRREKLNCELEIISPKRRGAIICDDSVQVCAAAAPSEGVPPFTRMATVNGIPAVFIGDTLCAVVPLQLGPNPIKVFCEFIDSRQSHFLCEDSIVVEGCRPLACAVEIISPATGLQICQDSIRVKARFTISDTNLVASRSFNINGFPAQANRDTLFATIPLAPGLNRIVAVCALIDTLGKARTGADTIQVTNCAPAMACQVKISAPATGAAFCRDAVEVCVNSNVSGGVEPILRTCQINGIAVADSCATILLTSGKNVIVAQCTFTDSLGASVTCADTIIVFSSVITCSTKITTPADSTFVCANSINISGTIGITNGAGLIQKICTVNGRPGVIDNNTFRGVASLAPGKNSIVVACTFVDSLGCEAACSDTVAIFSDPTPPQCTLNFDQLPLITGEAFDNESGIAKIDVIESSNRMVTIASFQAGDPVVRFSSEPINPNQISGLLLKITNRAGCVTFCDPIFLRLDPAASPSYTFTIPSADRFLSVNNRGLERIAMTLNRREIELVASASGNDVEGRSYLIPPNGSRTLDLAAFLVEGENNVTLIATGPVGSSADVIFSDVNTGTVTGVSDEKRLAETIPHTFELFQSYPNPFSAGNPSAAIRFHVPAGWAHPITLRVFNMQGQLVTTLVEGVVSPGVHTTKWDGKDGLGNAVASGVYLYQLTAGQLVVVRRMVFTK
jgi:hypothetical protein